MSSHSKPILHGKKKNSQKTFSEFNESKLFCIILALIAFPLAFFNVIWVFKIQHLIASEIFWNLTRLTCLTGGALLCIRSVYGGNRKKGISFLPFNFLVIIVVTALINQYAKKYPDTSSDSVTSHLLVTKAITLGWSPLSDDPAQTSFINSNFLVRQTNLTPGRIETGIGFQAIQGFYNKILNIEASYTIVNCLFILLALTCLINSNIFAEIDSKFIRNKSFLRTKLPLLIFLISPFVILQIFSAYTDLAGFCLIFTAMVLFLQIHFTNSINIRHWQLFTVVILIIPTIKLQLVILTIPLVAGLFTSSILVKLKQYNAARKISRRTILEVSWGALSKVLFVISIIVFPISTLTLDMLHGNLPHLSNKKYVAETWSGSIPQFMDLNGLERVWTVVSGRTAQNPNVIRLDGLFSMPDNMELDNAGYIDSRVAGFGPLWGDSLFLATIFSILLFVRINTVWRRKSLRLRDSHSFLSLQRKMINISMFLLISFLMISLFMPVSFMARYNPQYVLITMLSLYVFQLTGQFSRAAREARILSKMGALILVSLIFLNFAIIFNSYLTIQSKANQEIRTLVETKLALENSDPGKKIKFYFSNRSGLLLATTGALTEASYRQNVVDWCPPEKVLWELSDEIGLCEST